MHDHSTTSKLHTCSLSWKPPALSINMVFEKMVKEPKKKGKGPVTSPKEKEKMIRQLPLPRPPTRSHDTITPNLLLSQPANTTFLCPKISPTCRSRARIPPTPKCCNSRRLLLQGPGLLLLSTAFYGSKKPAFAEEQEEDVQTLTLTLPAKRLEPATCDELEITKKVYMDVAIDGEAAGRIVIGLFGNDAPIGASRFAELASGKRGVGYRKKEFVKITPFYIQNAGIRSYGVDSEMAKRSLLADELVQESVGLEKRCKGSKSFEGAVSLIVRDPSKPPSQIKLVAKGGKLEVQEEEVKPDPNGTEFVIATKSVPQLEVSNLLVGKVVDGMDVVARVASVKTVQENSGSPYFQVAKLIGDKRAIVAERGFNRPYSKIVITKCGELT